MCGHTCASSAGVDSVRVVRGLGTLRPFPREPRSKRLKAGTSKGGRSTELCAHKGCVKGSHGTPHAGHQVHRVESAWRLECLSQSLWANSVGRQH